MASPRLDVVRLSRWLSTTQTWWRKSAALIHREYGNARDDDQRWLVGYQAGNLVEAILFDLDALVPYLPNEQVEDVERRARELLNAVRAERRARKLERVEGRTPEEAESFLAKASELRGAR